jgi:hypothetical protein
LSLVRERRDVNGPGTAGGGADERAVVDRLDSPVVGATVTR